MFNGIVKLIAGLTISVTAVIALVIQLDLHAAPDIIIIAPTGTASIVVAIDGEVERPGVYELPYGSRVLDLLDASGGYLSASDLTAINQAELLIDGQRVFIPTKVGTRSMRVAASPGPLLIDINTATEAQIDELPGIGPVKAAAVVAYRNQHGPFRAVEELLLVEGISESTLDEIRAFVVIGP